MTDHPDLPLGDIPAVPPKRARGRPPGSKNKRPLVAIRYRQMRDEAKRMAVARTPLHRRVAHGRVGAPPLLACDAATLDRVFLFGVMRLSVGQAAACLGVSEKTLYNFFRAHPRAHALWHAACEGGESILLEVLQGIGEKLFYSLTKDAEEQQENKPSP
jgi:hypothetical protein